MPAVIGGKQRGFFGPRCFHLLNGDLLLARTRLLRQGKLSAAIRETAEEAGITDLAFRWGEAFCETAPYGPRKVARYYLAETAQQAVVLNRFPHGSRPEHHEWRWVNFDEAGRLLPPRLQPVLGWAINILEA